MTKYRGITFRHRLDATWAAFFDECHWWWEYQPFDLPGWSPAFAIWCDDERAVLVEITPTWAATESLIANINQSGVFDEGMELPGCDTAMILGPSPFYQGGYSTCWEYEAFGMLADRLEWDRAMLTITPGNSSYRLDVHQDAGGWGSWISGFRSGDSWAGQYDGEFVRRLWGNAKRTIGLAMRHGETFDRWRPIATAPRDGNSVLLRNVVTGPDGHGPLDTDSSRTCCVGHFADGAWRTFCCKPDSCPVWATPTHWMPLPKPGLAFGRAPR